MRDRKNSYEPVSESRLSAQQNQVGLVETVTIPIRAVAMQTSTGYGVAIRHPWESWAEVFWFRSRDDFTEAFDEARYEQKTGRGECALKAALTGSFRLRADCY